MVEANRWLHVRHPHGFSIEHFGLFKAHRRIFRANVEAVLAEWHLLNPRHPELVKYEFLEPTLSEDRRVASLPLGGDWTLLTRSAFENGKSSLLREWFPLEMRLHFEEGLTEMDPGWRPGSPRRNVTNWRKPTTL